MLPRLFSEIGIILYDPASCYRHMGSSVKTAAPERRMDSATV